MTRPLRIGTRRSVLAMWQAGFVKRRLEERWPGVEVELAPVVTTGDRVLDRPLALIGGKALFVKEIEDRLLDGGVDMAVHSMKDVPAELPAGLCLAATLERQDPADAFVAREASVSASFDSLPERGRIGTSSLRRACQLLSLRPDLEIVPIRGNVDTRLRKLHEERLDGLVLAAAALLRLDLEERITERFEPDRFLPAVGQGAMAVEVRENDEETQELVGALNHVDTADCVAAERGFSSCLEGGCQVPMGAYAILDGDSVRLRGLVGRTDGRLIISAEGRMPRRWSRGLGGEVAREILGKGGDEVLADALRAAASRE